jgi:ankyrin repeat protein
LDKGAAVDERASEPGRRVPSVLAEEGDQAVLRAGFDLCRTPLMLAIWKGHLDAVDRLLQAGADGSVKDALGYNALTLACREGHQAIVERLLARGASLKDRGPGKSSLLHLAVESGQTGLVGFLIEHGIDLDLLNGDGCPALDLAASFGHLEIFEQLLDAGADPTYRTRDGSNALCALICWTRRIEIPKAEAFSGKHVSVQWTGNKVYAQAYLDEELVLPILEKLLLKGAPVESEGPFSPLSYAAQSGRLGIVKRLLEAGADPNRRSPTTQQTPLDVARMLKRTEVVTILEALAREEKQAVVPELSQPDRWGPPLPAPDFRKAGRSRKFTRAVGELADRTGAQVAPLESAPGALQLTLPPESALDLSLEAGRLAGLGFFLFEPDGVPALPNRLVCLPSSRWQDAVALMGTNGANCDIGPGYIVQWLEGLEKEQPFQLLCITSALISGRFLTPISDPDRWAQEMADFCPDIVDQGCGTVEELALSLAESDQLFFWWD